MFGELWPTPADRARVRMVAGVNTWSMAGVVQVRVTHTADLNALELRAVRSLLDEAFDDDDEGFVDEDFEHALGGLHAVVWEGRDVIGHGAVVMRRLLHEGRALRTGYVEAVAVRADRRRRGHAGALMAALERVIRGGYQIGALSATGAAADFYAGRGWRVWTGTTSVLTPHGVERTAEDDHGVYVLPVDVDLASGGDLACDWRDGDVW